MCATQEVDNKDRVVFPPGFLDKANKLYPDNTVLHTAITDGDYKVVKQVLYDQIATGHGMTANELDFLPANEIRRRAKEYIDRSELYKTCTDFLNSYWATPVTKKT